MSGGGHSAVDRATLTALPGQAWLALGITALAFGLFIWDRFRPDVVALFVAVLLIVSGLVTPAQGVSGFANEATITVAMLLILATGLTHTGAVDVVVRHAVRLAGRSELRLLLLVVGVVVPVSAFINNTAAVAILVPALLGASRQVGVAPSRLLMPLSFASQLGGSLTLIGTTTNLLVAGLLIDLGFERIQIFEITPPALMVAGAGMLYLFTIGRWLTPRRETSPDLLENYQLHDYLTALRIRDDSPLVGRSIAESRFGREQGLTIIQVERRDGETVSVPGSATVLRAGDLLMVEGKIQDIARLGDQSGMEVEGADPHLPELGAEPDEGDEDPVRLAEMLVPPRSPATGRSLRTLRLRTRHSVSAIGLRRHGAAVVENMGDVTLRPGDVLLVRGRESAMGQLHESGLLSLVGPVELAPRRRSKMKWAVLALGGAVLLAAFDVVPIMVGAMMGVVFLLLTRTVGAEEAYEEMDWMVVVLLAAILPLGIALQESGAAAGIAGSMEALASPWGPYGLLAAIYILTSLLTNAISNVAAAALMLPIAAALAGTAGLSPTPFAVAVMFAASNAFLTPIGYQTNLFVYGPGGYRFTDFLRVGAPLSVVTATVSVIAIPIFMPF